MIRIVDALLERVTMYRLALYCLFLLCIYSAILSSIGLLRFSTQDILILAVILTVVSWGSNKILAKLFSADENLESSLITGLILALIINPEPAIKASVLFFWASAAIFANASKYLIAPFKKHIFNPAGIAVVLTTFLFNQPPSWWVGTDTMLPAVLVTGLLLMRKLRREELILSFIAISFALIIWNGGIGLLNQTFFQTPIFFFAFVMLIEPSTSPPTKITRSAYGALTGLLAYAMTYELALIFGNIFSYAMSPKFRPHLILKEKKLITSTNIFEFIFTPDKKINFLPGQFMEWTLKHGNADARGVRRYFTIASSPTESEIRLGTKIFPNGSSFKKALFELSAKKDLFACKPEGDFIMPSDKSKKLVFIAGGIGITPFRSMIKYLIDTNEKRDIILLYSNKTESEIAYREIFDEAREKLGLKVIYINSSTDGPITDKMVMGEAPDFKERYFYISGPRGMTGAFTSALIKIGISKSQIKTDFFPGYA